MREKPLGKSTSSRERAWAYLAVSSAHQEETLEHQRRWAEDAAAQQRWQLVRIVEGVGSGKSGPRKSVLQLLDDVRTLDSSARPRYILMIRLDRLGRGPAIESQLLLHELGKLGVSVYTRENGHVALDTPMQELFSYMQAVVAHQENAVRRDKARSVYERKRAAGAVIGNRRPYGLRLKNGKDVRDGKRADAILKAFKLRAAGYGYFRIGKELGSFAPPAVNKKGEEKTLQWGMSRVAMLLNNRAYIGPIVNEALFLKAQRAGKLLAAAERDRDKRRKWEWPLSGSLRCYCGMTMTGQCTGQGGSRTRYYACRSHQNHEEGKIRLVRADDLESAFVKLLKDLKASPDLLRRYRKRAASPLSPKALEQSMRTLRAEIAKADKDRDKVFDLYLAGNVRREDVQGKIDTLTARREELTARLASVNEHLAALKIEAQSDNSADALLRRAATIFEKAAEADQRAIARAVAVELGGLYVSNDDRELVVGPAPLEPGATPNSSRSRRTPKAVV